MRKLHSFTKLKSRPLTSALSVQATNQDPKFGNRIDEESELIVDTSNSVPNSGEVKAQNPDTGRLSGIEAEVSTETLEELVDQMEIQISDHEDEGDTEDAMESTHEDENSQKDGKIDQPTKEGTEKVKMSAVIAATDASSGTVASSSAVESGVVKPEKRRRHSSMFERIEFPSIFLDKQLSDDDIIELMELLQVRVLVMVHKC